MTKTERQNMWQGRISKYKASGQSVKEWCADNDVKPHQLWYWLRKERQASEDRVSWLPIDIRDSDQQESLLVRVGRVTVEVKPGFNPKLLLDIVNTFLA